LDSSTDLQLVGVLGFSGKLPIVGSLFLLVFFEGIERWQLSRGQKRRID